ncbi:MAG: hypothetical protein RLZZ473_1082, partial [Pseudomonadota bacterium]
MDEWDLIEWDLGLNPLAGGCRMPHASEFEER